MKKTSLGCAFVLCILLVSCTKPAEPMVVEVSTTMGSTAEPTPTLHSIYSGRPVQTQGYPVAVSIPNDPTARPQYNIAQADVVYEMYAEGDVTRMIALYGDHQPEQVGPVRSGRIYMVDVVDDWGAAFVHFGGSEGGKFDLPSKIKKSKIRHEVDGMKSGSYFQRTQGFRAPNNALFSLASYAGTITSAPPELGPLTFAKQGEHSVGTPITQVSIPYSGSNKVRYVFDGGAFQRFVGDKPFVDRATGEQVVAHNVILQQVKRVGGSDKSGHINLQMTGSGSATYYINGQRIQGSWERGDSSSSTVYKDAAGNPVVFAPGKTFVQVTTSSIKATDG